MQPGGLKISECEVVQQALLAGRELTAGELVHANACELCADAVMETEIEAALMVKPRMEVPEGFAARVARELPARRGARQWARQKLAGGQWLGRHAGSVAAVAVLVVTMVVAALVDPQWFEGMPSTSVGVTWFGMTWMLVLAGEVAGIGLWMGLRTEG